MKGALADYLAARATGEPLQAAAPDVETRRRLEALGYIQGGSADEVEIREELNGGGVAPQDRVQRTSEISRVKDLLTRREALGARELAQQLVREDPDSPYYLQLLASAEAQLGRFDEAIALLERQAAVEGEQRAPGALLEVARLMVQAGRDEQALVQLEHVRSMEETVEGLYLLGSVAMDLGRSDEAADAFEAVLRHDEDHGPSLVDLGILRAAEGRSGEAAELLQRAVAADPYSPKCRFNLGVSLLDQGRPMKAAEQFERAADLAPDYLIAYRAAGVAYLRAGDREAALGALGRLEGRAPDSSEVAELRGFLELEEGTE
ncbi:MAG: tetratricopeptide repeat protein [Thermoanaerobaculia bacterium]